MKFPFLSIEFNLVPRAFPFLSFPFFPLIFLAKIAKIPFKFPSYSGTSQGLWNDGSGYEIAMVQAISFPEPAILEKETKALG
jgi:hypothetical protein